MNTDKKLTKTTSINWGGFWLLEKLEKTAKMNESLVVLLPRAFRG